MSGIKDRSTTNKNGFPSSENTYVLKPPLKAECMECGNSLIVLFCPPKQDYSKKNNWGWWTQKLENKGKYKCDACLINMYNNRKFDYLEAITDSKKRRLLRSYFYDKRFGTNN